jgi:hypothetical protein
MSVTQSFYIESLKNAGTTYVVVQDTNKFYRLEKGNTTGNTFVSNVLSVNTKIVKQNTHYVFVLEYNTSNVNIITPEQTIPTESNVFQTVTNTQVFKQLYIANNKPYLISSNGKIIYTIQHVSASNVIEDINESSINIRNGKYTTQKTKFQPPTGYVVTYIDPQGNITLYKSGRNPDLKTIKAPLVSSDNSGYEPQVRQEPPEPYVAPPKKKNNTVMLVILLILFFLFMKHSASH